MTKKSLRAKIAKWLRNGGGGISRLNTITARWYVAHATADGKSWTGGFEWFAQDLPTGKNAIIFDLRK